MNIWSKNANIFFLVLPKLPTKIVCQFISFILFLYQDFTIKNISVCCTRKTKNLFLIVLVTIYIYSLFFPLYYCSYIILFRKFADSGLYSQMISLLAASFYMSFFQQIFFTLLPSCFVWYL